jgi:hypothetical protein
MLNKFVLTSVVMLTSLIVASCSSGNIDPLNERYSPKNWKKGSVITGKNERGVTLDDFINPSTPNGAMPINALLWRAALDTVSVMPLDSVDTFGGTIITEWYAHPDNPNQRIKIAIFVVDQELRADAINIQTYLQERDATTSEWRDIGRDDGLSRRLEDLILTRAREIRASTILETN